MREVKSAQVELDFSLTPKRPTVNSAYTITRKKKYTPTKLMFVSGNGDLTKGDSVIKLYHRGDTSLDEDLLRTKLKNTNIMQSSVASNGSHSNKDYNYQKSGNNNKEVCLTRASLNEDMIEPSVKNAYQFLPRSNTTLPGYLFRKSSFTLSLYSSALTNSEKDTTATGKSSPEKPDNRYKNNHFHHSNHISSDKDSGGGVKSAEVIVSKTPELKDIVDGGRDSALLPPTSANNTKQHQSNYNNFRPLNSRNNFLGGQQINPLPPTQQQQPRCPTQQSIGSSQGEGMFIILIYLYTLFYFIKKKKSFLDFSHYLLYL